MGRCMRCGKPGCEISDYLHLCGKCEKEEFCKEDKQSEIKENAN